MKYKYINKKNFAVIIIAFVIMISANFFVNDVCATQNIKGSETVINITDGTEKKEIVEKNTESTETIDNVEGIFDSKGTEGIYKVSEDKISYLPFIRYALDRVIVDKEISGFGTLFSATNIEVNSPMKGMQLLFANDTVRINSDMEYATIFSTNNTVIDSKIDKPIIVFSSGNITITEKAVLNSDIICYCDTLNVEGTVKGSILGAATNVNITGKVEKDLRMQLTNLNAENNEKILGNVYVETYNKELNVLDKYPDANLKILEIKTSKFTYDMIMDIIVTCLLFTLVYVIINKKTNGKIYEHATSKFRDNLLFSILSGSITLLALPALAMLLIMLSIFGLHAVTLPMLVIYVSGVLVVGMLSSFIVGSLLANYMSKNYFKDKSAFYNIVGAFFVFLSLQVLSKIQYIGMYVTMSLLLFAVGIVMTYIFKKNNKIVSKVEEKKTEK